MPIYINCESLANGHLVEPGEVKVESNGRLRSA